MSESKYFDKIAWSVTAIILIITILFMNGPALGIEVMASTMGYENRLFDNTRVHTIDIVMNNWEEFIDNASSEEYYTATVVIDGEAYKNVAIRGKGNTSLSNVASMNSDRYSFKVEFDHYDSSITYHGLDKLALNNLIQDATMMKDYLTYTMMNEFDAASPLCSFAYITVNGEDWGLYLAVEGVEDSFLERNYGTSYGELYKPDSTGFGGGRGNGKDFNIEDFVNNEKPAIDSEQGMPMPDRESFDPSSTFSANVPAMSSFDPSQMQGNAPQIPDMTQGESNSENGDRFSFGGKGGFGGMGSSDVKLQYVDDNISSYSNIWNNAKTDVTEADQIRLIESLKKLSEGDQIESVVDVEKVMRYFVVHNYVCNGDSYTGSMIHNYYLYEEDGKMAMIPWDYNLAYGTFQGGNGQSTVNTPIDSPVSNANGEDRPMWNWIVQNEEYTQQYHRYFTEFLNTVDVQGIINDAYNLIKSYVERDPTAFYTYEEFENGVEALRQFCSLRSNSIALQLENGETTNNTNYSDASSLNISNMGSMGMGLNDRNKNTESTENNFDKSKDFTSPQNANVSQDMENIGVEPSFEKNSDTEDPEQSTKQPFTDREQTQKRSFNSFNVNADEMNNSQSGEGLWLIVSFSVLIIGLIIAKVYKH
ncbi:MAG: CotH kinase family protein [Clostridia bacterium]|nr:CotH kinase family protein [Clostridia bacterium]MBQ7897753.1 CotH kinase family protein [Clostridia bacterium]